jgi:hypothetical protein
MKRKNPPVHRLRIVITESTPLSFMKGQEGWTSDQDQLMLSDDRLSDDSEHEGIIVQKSPTSFIVRIIIVVSLPVNQPGEKWELLYRESNRYSLANKSPRLNV